MSFLKGQRLNNISPQSEIKKKIERETFIDKPKINTIFFLGVVLKNEDKKKQNRLKVRIPVHDDIFFSDNQDLKTQIDSLPWAIPHTKRIVDVPDEGSVVLIAVFQIDDIYNARIWFDCIDFQDSNIEYSDPKRLSVNELDGKAWGNFEQAILTKFNISPGLRGNSSYPTYGSKKNRSVIIRGRSKNSLEFDVEKTTLFQNKGENSESSISLSENVDIESSNEIELISRKSSKRRKAVFDKEILDLFEKFLSLNTTLVNMMKAPGISTPPTTPVAPSPEYAKLQSDLLKLITEFNIFKTEGISKYITIN
jgi:hypothetical protein